MNEIAFSAAALGCAALAYLWRRACKDLRLEQRVTQALDRRLAAVTAEKMYLQAKVSALGAENTELQRENGRFVAEIRQLNQEAERRKQPRDPKTGRMLPKPNAKRPRKPRANAAA